MSLEAKIGLLSEQITQLTDAVTVLKNVLLAQNEAPSLDSIRNELKYAPVTTEALAEDPNVNSSATIDTSQPSSNESRTVTYDDVKNVTIAMSKIDKAKAVASLAQFGVTTAKALNENQWLNYVLYMEKVVTGEVDPESSHE